MECIFIALFHLPGDWYNSDESHICKKSIPLGNLKTVVSIIMNSNISWLGGFLFTNWQYVTVFCLAK